jgi:hypothetical protein
MRRVAIFHRWELHSQQVAISGVKTLTVFFGRFELYTRTQINDLFLKD